MQAWENFLKAQEDTLSKESVAKWLRTLKVVHFDACNLYLEAKDSFQVLWFEEHIRSLVRKELVNNNNRPIKVHLTISDTDAPAKDTAGEKKGNGDDKRLNFESDDLDPLATFENYYPTLEQHFPLRILHQLTGYNPETRKYDSPSLELATFNPIYLYGTAGTGKTHLLNSIAHAFKKRGLNVLFVRAESFTQHVVKAIRSGEMQKFRNVYRNSDLLIIDDVDLFARRSATQEELFHTFNTLHTSHKQIILSANTPPNLLEAIEPRLTSRFEWGITFKLEKQSDEEIKKILDMRSKALGFPLSEELLDFLITSFKSNIKALFKALDALILRSHMEKTERPLHYRLDVPAAKIHLHDLITEESQTMLCPIKIVRAVADYYGIRSDDIVGKSQKQECTLPRQIAMHICRTKLKMPYIKIGKTFERDHSTVMSSIKQIQKKLDLHDKEVIATLPAILRNLETDSVKTKR